MAKGAGRGMADFSRYAIYVVPEGPLADWGAGWLGWDIRSGKTAVHPDCGLDVAALTAAPRRYGLHGTVKPPFRLARPLTELEAAAETLAARLAPVQLDGLELARLGRFLALRAVGDVAALAALAAEVVQALDTFRAPAPEAELVRRRAAGLTERQEALLADYGYPYVMEEFRFHITLTGAVDPGALQAAELVLRPMVAPLLPRPFVIGDLALAGEDGEGRFHLVHRYPLRG